MNESELKARLAEAEGLFSRYRWEEAIACFEAILAARPDHSAASQGLADALEQLKTDRELAETIVQARQSLTAHQFSDALAALNRAQTRGAMRHILKYHGEIDALRSQAQEGRELQRSADQVLERAEGLAGQRKFDAAVVALDGKLQELSARGWESLGVKLRAARDRLWSERDVDERIRFALAAFERQDYQTATELAEALHRQMPRRDDVARLLERARTAWGRIQERLKGVQERLAEERLDDAVAMLVNLRDEYPHNPDWQALWLKAHMDHARNQVAAGRREMANHRFDGAAEAFAAAVAAFNDALGVFDRHPTAGLERAEAEALYAAASFAAQGALDGAAGRWEPSRRAWEAARERLQQAAAARQRDFGEMVAVVDTMLADVSGTVADLEQVHILLAEGREALEERDAGRARECFRNALNRTGKSPDAVRAEALAGVRAAERAQREAKKLLAQAEQAIDNEERLTLLSSAYERWMTAPGLSERLANALLTAADAALVAGDETQAASYCAQIRTLPGVTTESQAQVARMAAGISGRRQVRAALTEAGRALVELERSPAPSAAGYARIADILARANAHGSEAPELAANLRTMLQQARDRHDRLAAVEPQIARSETLRQAGDWGGAARELHQTVEQLGDLAGDEIRQRADKAHTIAAEIGAVLVRAGESLARAEKVYAAARDGDPTRVAWPELQAALDQTHAELADSPADENLLPRAWDELRTRADDLAARAAMLRQIAERVQAGGPVEALPLLQVQPGVAVDPVLRAVFVALRRASAGDARERAASRIAAAEAHLASGELQAAEGALTDARAYSQAAPDMVPDARRLEKRIEMLSRVRRWSADARGHLVAGRAGDALRSCRQALESVATREIGFPIDVREPLNALLVLEEDLWDEAARTEAEALYQALQRTAADNPLLRSCLVLPLRHWWRLACRAADVAFVEAQLALEHYPAAYGRISQLVANYPTDRQGRELYARVRQQTLKHVTATLHRRLDRAARLRDEGAFGYALADLDRIEAEQLAPLRTAAPDLDREGTLEPLFEFAADLRLELIGLDELGRRIAPLAEQARAAGLAGHYAEAQSALAQIRLLDPHQRTPALWVELSALGEVLHDQAQAAARTRLTAVLSEADARLEVHPSTEELREIIMQLAALALAARTLDGPEADAFRKQFAEIKARAASAWACTGQGVVVIAPAATAAPLAPAAQPIEPPRPAVVASPPLYVPAPPPDPMPHHDHTTQAAEPVASGNGHGDMPQPSRQAAPKRKNGVEHPAAVAGPDEPPTPFDFDDWGSNVSPLAPEDDGTG